MRTVLMGLSSALLVVTVAATANAGNGPVAVPEIDGGTLSMGLAFLAGGTLFLRSRFQRK